MFNTPSHGGKRSAHKALKIISKGCKDTTEDEYALIVKALCCYRAYPRDNAEHNIQKQSCSRNTTSMPLTWWRFGKQTQNCLIRNCTTKTLHYRKKNNIQVLFKNSIFLPVWQILHFIKIVSVFKWSRTKKPTSFHIMLGWEHIVCFGISH